jgi:capsular exopolysaccharide synthesis family protein
MSKIYEALIKAGRGSNEDRPTVKFTTFNLFRAGRRLRIDFDLEPDVEEQYQKLRHRVLPGPKHPAIKIIMVAATDHGEGGTTTAAILASTLARSKNFKTLLIDANPRTPALDDVFTGQQNPAGLSDVVLAEVDLEQSIYQTDLPNLFVLPCGKPVASPSYIFDGEAMTDLLNKLRNSFDFIIFDASPLGSYSESSFLASKVDGVILVIEAERTKAEVVKRIKKELESADVTILGVVLNKKKKYIPAFFERFL